MSYVLRLMRDADARAIAGWHYECPYRFYDAEQDADDLAELLDAEARGEAYWAATDRDGDLQGFFSFRVEGTAVEIGLGMRPDLTGQGHGLAFVRCGLAFARARYQPTAIVLHVAAFNQRAIRVYERAGFVAVSRLMRATNGGQHEFVKMMMPVP